MAFESAAMYEDAVQAQWQSRRRQLQTFLDAEYKRVETVMRQGDPVREIAAFAHNEKIDLILMPTHGLRHVPASSAQVRDVEDSALCRVSRLDPCPSGNARSRRHAGGPQRCLRSGSVGRSRLG